jgi:hypothetical protein
MGLHGLLQGQLYLFYHEDTWGSGGIAPPFLTSALERGEWSASRPGRFISGEEIPGTHWIDQVGPTAHLDVLE